MTIEEMKVQRDALKEALNSGALQVRHGDKSITYQSTANMEKALRRLEAEITATERGGKRIRRRYALTQGKGL